MSRRSKKQLEREKVVGLTTTVKCTGKSFTLTPTIRKLKSEVS